MRDALEGDVQHALGLLCR